MTSTDLYHLHGRTPYEIITGNTPDISEYCQYRWYDPVYYLEKTNAFPQDKLVLGRWLGVAHRVGQALCYYVLLENGQVIARTTVQQIPHDDIVTDEVKQHIAEFDCKIALKFGPHEYIADVEPHSSSPGMTDVDDDDMHFELWEEAIPEADDLPPEFLDEYISAHVLLPKGDSYVKGQVISRKRNADGNVRGKANANPILDSRVYEVQFSDGHTKEYAANVIAEAVYDQVDDEGYEHPILDEIIDYRKDMAVAISDDERYIVAANGNRHPRQMTKRWELCILWKDKSTSWVALKDLKEGNPLQVAEFAIANGIANEPAFTWWIKDTLKKRDRIISAIKTQYLKHTHKFGIQMPKTVQEALAIDREMGTDCWRKAIEKEMKNVEVAFTFLEPGHSVPNGYQKLPLHFVFDVKMDFTCKAQLVAGGHMTDAPSSITYSSIMSRDSVRIALMVAALNDLDILSADIGNAYLNTETREKVYAVAGPEFGSKEGQIVIITRALYGLKSSGATWRAHLAESLHTLGYNSSLADPDVWMRPAVRENGDHYYEYVLVYVDDILSLSANPRETMNSIAKLYRLKETPCKPSKYLGVDIIEHSYPDAPAKRLWGMPSYQFVRKAIRVVELELNKVGKRLATKASTPMHADLM